MDTIGIVQRVDTGIITTMEQAQVETKENNSFSVFVMGIMGVFIFVLLYVSVVKVVAMVSQRNKKINRK
jgi:flagellar biosynthesis/type III secretory pathway M-ring protein FliF/YscJ